MATAKRKRRIIIECNEPAFRDLLPLLETLRRLGDIGASRSIVIEDYDGKNRFGFDGDGPSKIESIIEKSNKEHVMGKSIALVIPLDKEQTQDETISMPTELLKAREHLGRAKGTGNAKGTIAPRDPEKNRKPKMPKGSPKPEKSDTGQQKRIPKLEGHKPPYDKYKTKVSGEKSDAVDNYLKLTNTTTGKVRKVNISAGSANKAKFNNSGNLVSVTVDGTKYPCANHLVKLPSGVYRYSGMVSVAAKVVGASK